MLAAMMRPGRLIAMARTARLSIPLLVIAAGLFWPAPATALDPDHRLSQCLQRIWQTQQGLPPSPIRAIYQTHNGYLWLGFQNGLARFDGVAFNTLREDWAARLEHIWVQALCEDAAERLWIATDGDGLLRIDGHHVESFGRDVAANVRGVVIDKQNTAWAATSAGLLRVTAQTKLFRAADGLASDDLHAVAIGADQTIWSAGVGNQLNSWDGDRWTQVRLSSISRQAVVRSLLAGPDGILWIGSSEGLVRLQDGVERRWTTADGLANDVVLSLAPGAHGVTWVGTRDGVSRVRDDDVDSFHPRDGLSQSTAYAVREDREGSLWVGTKNGLNQFVDRRTLLYTTREGLATNDIGPVLQDKEGDIWVGTLGAGLSRFKDRRFALLDYEHSAAEDTIHALASLEKGLLVGSEGGLRLLEDGRVRETWTQDTGLPSNQVRAICSTPRGQYVGTTAGLVHIDPAGKVSLPLLDGKPLTASIVAVAARHNSEVLVATTEGELFRIRDELLELWPGAPQRRQVVSFFCDDDDRVWMGSAGDGLWLVDETDGNQSVTHFTSKDGLYDDEVCGLVTDARDRLWMACSKGIFYVPRAQLLDFVAERVKRLNSTPFTPLDSLRTIECQPGVQPSAFRMANDHIWFATRRGLIVIDPDRLERSLPPAPVLVEEVVVNGQDVQPDLVGHLPPGSNTLEFHYAALSFVAPNRIQYRYRLEGFDSDWIDAGTRRAAFYTNLAPGSYQFRVAAKLLDASWQEAPVPVDMVLEPFFYQRRWFAPLVAGCLALAAWGAYRLRVRRIKRHLQLILAERSRIARELHDTLMQGFSGVTMQLQALRTRLERIPERETLDEIIRDAGVCLREARRSVAGLRNSRGDTTGLSAAIGRAASQLTEARDVRLELNLAPAPPVLPDDVQYNLLCIVQEAVSNAIQHADATTIAVSLDCSDEQLRMKVVDDGRGLGREALPAGHYGLIGMRERASQIGADFRVESAPGQGTVVSLQMAMTGARGKEA